ncbi:serine/threonine protein kinase [Synechococcus sp. CB0101]|uniref:serine/threonine protein kinase n=1 Tax=Synechococcus sp. CB0101 TaxID=232348 RepID=UPI0010AA1841|nr:phosphotransferase [Synechococcus sp. CB0101]QCH15077.1 serine/threonine protein kinase [Synechococcus sp. CB0101]
MPASTDQVIAGRYRLERRLSATERSELWRACDQLAGEAPVALRCIPAEQPTLQAEVRSLWPRLQGVLHPQVPRFGELIEQDGALWLPREWQEGSTFAELLQGRRERQLVFGAGEVLLLLRQLLPALAVLHSQELCHGDLSPANLLRRDRDGLPVLLDFGPGGVTPGYAPPERSRGEAPAPWMDLYSLAVVALVLLSGEEPAQLLDPTTLAWRWPVSLDALPALQEVLARLLSTAPEERFPSASATLQALQQIPMPDSTGPVARADRTVVLVPSPAAAEPALPVVAAGATSPAAALLPRTRQELKEEAAEGRLWPVVIALVVSAVLGTGLGWLVLSRGRVSGPTAAPSLQLPSSLPPAEVNQRQQLLNRLRALQIDRGWFLKLVDASLLAQYPERGGRLPSDSLDDAPLRKVWNQLAEDWLSRVEQLPLELRTRLGRFTAGDWRRRQSALVSQGLSGAVVEQLVSGSAQNLLPGRAGSEIPPEPFRQLWYAAAEQGLAQVRIEAIQARLGETTVISASVPAGGARLFPIRLPVGSGLVLGVNGSPLMQMSVFGADGAVLEARGPLRVVNLGEVRRSPVQLLVTNEGLAAALITLSLRADPAALRPVAPPEPPSAPLNAPLAPARPEAAQQQPEDTN